VRSISPLFYPVSSCTSVSFIVGPPRGHCASVRPISLLCTESAGTVVHEPIGPEPDSQYDGTSIVATIKKIFGASVVAACCPACCRALRRAHLGREGGGALTDLGEWARRVGVSPAQACRPSSQSETLGRGHSSTSSISLQSRETRRCTCLTRRRRHRGRAACHGGPIATTRHAACVARCSTSSKCSGARHRRTCMLVQQRLLCGRRAVRLGPCSKRAHGWPTRLSTGAGRRASEQGGGRHPRLRAISLSRVLVITTQSDVTTIDLIDDDQRTPSPNTLYPLSARDTSDMLPSRPLVLKIVTKRSRRKRNRMIGEWAKFGVRRAGGMAGGVIALLI
jgi:hypothetical protein